MNVRRAVLAAVLCVLIVPASAGAQAPPDNDRDGYPAGVDCNDAASDIHPGAVELPENRIDENCDGFLADVDGDGFDRPADCDDSEPGVRPGAVERPANTIDENCDGFLADVDSDGFNRPQDCDDTEPGVRPGAVERPANTIDENCDGFVADVDSDGFDRPRDCDDTDPRVRPGAVERPANTIDENCDGFLADVDSDGFDRPQDCDDTDPRVRPGAVESAGNRIDENCDGAVIDRDGDGFDPPGDCDDGDRGVYPGAPEPRWGRRVDANCDGRRPLSVVHALVRLSARALDTGATRVASVSVLDLDGGEVIRLSCRGGGCGGLRTRAVRARRGRDFVRLTRFVAALRLQAGAVLEVGVTAPKQVGRVFRYTMRGAGRGPRRSHGCQPPGERSVLPCARAGARATS